MANANVYVEKLVPVYEYEVDGVEHTLTAEQHRQVQQGNDPNRSLASVVGAVHRHEHYQSDNADLRARVAELEDEVADLRARLEDAETPDPEPTNPTVEETPGQEEPLADQVQAERTGEDTQVVADEADKTESVDAVTDGEPPAADPEQNPDLRD